MFAHDAGGRGRLYSELGALGDSVRCLPLAAGRRVEGGVVLVPAVDDLARGVAVTCEVAKSPTESPRDGPDSFWAPGTAPFPAAQP